MWSANRNEAFQPFEELFEDKTLAEKTVYRQVTEQLPEYFATRPLIPLPGSKPVSLLELLRAPAVGSPRSLSDQLALIRRLWKPLLGESLERLLLMAGEILHEEELAIWMLFNPSPARRGAASNAWPTGRRPFRSAGIRRSGARIRKIQPGYSLDAHRGAYRQEHLRLAGSAQQTVRPQNHPPR